MNRAVTQHSAPRNTAPEFEHFLCSVDELQHRLGLIDPVAYARSRNHLSGAVTWLSPFLTHGILDTCDIAQAVLNRHDAKACHRLLFELAWREFFHRTWQDRGDAIFSDLRQAQESVVDEHLPGALIEADTGIRVIDECVTHLHKHGAMHNHARMWVASVACNLAGTRWLTGARWFHFHLLDGDLASNTLSWQWIAGSFSHKVYLANQHNIDRYSGQMQPGSWLDVSYEALNGARENGKVPPRLQARKHWSERAQTLPGKKIDRYAGRVALYSPWSLDPRWQPEAEHRLCFLDDDLHAQWPMSEKRWQFIAHWAAACGATLCHGTQQQLETALEGAEVLRREYPTSNDWPGQVEPRRWLYPQPGSRFTSFSKFWKQVEGRLTL